METENKNIMIKDILFVVIIMILILSIDLSLAYAVKAPNYTTHQYITREAGNVWESIFLEVGNYSANNINHGEVICFSEVDKNV